MVAVRWYLLAPRGASLYPQRSWEELAGRFLGLMAYLDPKYCVSATSITLTTVNAIT